MTDIRREIEELLVRLAWTQDNASNQGFSALFTEDCEFDAMLRICHGRAAIDQFFADREVELGTQDAGIGRHVISNLILHETGESFVRAQHVQTVYAGVGPGPHPAVPAPVLDMHDEIVREADGAWRIRKRKSHMAFGGMPQAR